MKGYFDYNATTPISDGVQQATIDALAHFGNPSGRYRFSQESKRIVSDTRLTFARFLSCEEEEIFFTSGGTESNNLAIRGVLDQSERQNLSGQHVICSAIEHSSVIELLNWYHSRLGLAVTFVQPNREGRIQVEDIQRAIRPSTCLITVMAINNEIGTIQPIEDIAVIANAHSIHFHVDAVQAVGKIPLNLERVGAHTVAFSGHKFYAPKGIGGLYCKKSSVLSPLFVGGGQEKGLRGGTENTLGIAALHVAANECAKDMQSQLLRFASLRSLAITLLQQHDITFQCNGSDNAQHQAPWTLNISIQGIRGEALAARLDICHGIAVSLGSACSNNKQQNRSHVLKSMGLSNQDIDSAIRISFGKQTLEEDIHQLVDAIAKEVGFLNRLSQVTVEDEISAY
ncbi:hypothetical protein BS333_03960 [Vibrio azureus]|uniref:cysteine desulfurase n=1 Tax=Vibrio azureus NBRC 104587 TaxID=1219077 RepID=U3CGI6_9VIBR|nr:cysteine desulfurase family protein [Vibrio azureus]AUI85589.1 hypothetical protein BS333_03960 [Vibrio azureus]GAD77393.1 putative cysteine desulfurase [Vibrio azureus NBRC 104587]